MSDPLRLLDDPSAGSILRSDLAAASAAKLQGLDGVAGLCALQAALGAETGAISTVAATGAGGSLLAKLLLGAVAIGGVSAWVVVAQQDAPAVAEPVPARPVPGGFRERPSSAPAIVTPAASEIDTPADAATPPDEEPAPVAEPEPEATPAADPGAAEPEPKSARPRRLVAVDDAVVREARQVQAARRALASDASHALALTESIADEFPHGQLVEERLAIAIRALAKLGRLDEARTRAESFLAKYGRGAHAAAVKRAVGRAD